ncbi:MAG: DUF2256 and DUF3253 domain-containing protein [Acidimicrobiales bacterium]|nr:DUF2256 and DUF3253 domain-containing protein [Acidimicrobiales bacterium]
MGRELPSKSCASCGRSFVWRKAWERSWDEVRYCSQACRRRGVRPVDRALEDALRDMIATQRRDGSVCPSEAARRVAPQQWRALMEPARAAARRLVAAGEAEITQQGLVVDPSSARGPIRVRRPR